MLPEFSLGSNLSIQSYFVYLSLLYSGLLFYLLKRARAQKVNVLASLNLGLIIMIFGFLGGRLFHVIYEAPLYYLDHPFQILEFARGGYVYFGGMLFALFGCWIYLRRIQENFWKYGDLFAPIAALGYGLGRISCFLSGCCYGRTCDLPWAVNGRHPTQLYAVVWELLLWLILLFAEARFKKTNPDPRPPHRHGQLFLIWLIGHALGRLIQEQFRDDFRGPQLLNLSVSSLIALLLLITASTLLFRKSKQIQ